MKCFLVIILISCMHWNFLIEGATARAPIVLKNAQDYKTVELMRYAKAASIKNFMNETIQPCDDFYKYACGNWARINPAVKMTKNNIFSTLSAAYDRKIVQWINNPEMTSDSKMERNVKYFYQSCMNVNEDDSNYRDRLLSVMEQFGGMPALKGDNWKSDEFDWLTVSAEILRKYGKKIIIGVDVSSDVNNNEENRLYIGQPERMISARVDDYYNRLRLQYLIEMNLVLGLNFSIAGKIAYEVSQFEMALAKGISDPLDGLTFIDKIKMRSLEDMTNTYGPAMNITRFVSSWLGYNYNRPVYEYVESYLQNLKNVIENTKESTIANYIMWNLIQDFRMETEEVKEKQKTKCIDRTKRFFVQYLDNVVYRKLSEKNKNLLYEIKEIWQDLKEVFEETLLGRGSVWMTPETRFKALEKLYGMTVEINSYENEDFDRDNAALTIGNNTFFENLISIMEQRGEKLREKVVSKPKLDSGDIMNFTPAYAPDFNRILMPVAFMQPRYLWDPAYPVAIKYATVGYVIAHEITHAFDDNAREFDSKGNLKNWWDQRSTEEFLLRKECLSQHYSEYRFAGRKIPRSNAQDENIADNVGIRVAFHAYERWLSKNEENSTILERETFPDLELTPRQLFFLGVAQIWCTDVHPAISSYLAKIDVHVPEIIRVAAMMSNFQSFADEFQCKTDAKMNPQRKCSIF